MSLTALAALALLLTTEPPTAPAPKPTTPICTAACCGALSGAVTARFECSVEASYDEKRVMLVISPGGPVAGVTSILPARIEVAYPLEGRSYSLATVAAGESRIKLTEGAEYLASGAKGELALDLDGLERYSAPRKRYRVTGTLRARLVPTMPTSAGEVHLEVRF
jgi:hypothetical protein